LAKVDLPDVMEICNYCMFDDEPQICSCCGMYCKERGNNYYVPATLTILGFMNTAMKMIKRREA